ncbi:MAG: hypothetical protein PHH85_02320 [Candidatus Methanoperedens sp.]|nr:hypothetical protein [Candidatus Methanoperedens sp.]
MINIKNGRIYFYNSLKPEIPVRDFHCISAYICPVCKNVLKAYFTGYMAKESLSGYMEKETLKYAYRIGNTEGGTWISFDLYTHGTMCSWELAGTMSRGIGNCVNSFLEINNTKVRIIEALVNKIESGNMPGFKVVQDEIDNDKPMLMYNTDEMLERKELRFEEYVKSKKDIGGFLNMKLLLI